MHQTLFTIPHAWLGAPLWYGWLALGLVVVSSAIARRGWGADALNWLIMFALGAAAIRWILPQIEVPGVDLQNPDGPLVVAGLAIRGYGVFLMLGIVAGVALCLARARQVGIDPERIFSLCFWLVVFGLLGARLFYVIQKWDSYAGAKTAGEFAAHLLDMTEGGLVVYGSLFGGLAAWLVFCRATRLPVGTVGDIMAPAMLVGLFLGRLGCLMNGCCYGDVCSWEPLGASFPAGAPAYYRQMEQGQLLGAVLDEVPAADGKKHREVRSVEPGSIAERYGIQVGDQIVGMALPADLFIRAIKDLDVSFRSLERNSLVIERTGAPPVVFPVEQLPDRTLPTYPTQLLSALDALLLAAWLWFYYPFRRADGELMAIVLMVYPISRFLVEMLRDDEAGVFGTPFSMGQIVSLLCILPGFALFAWLRTRRPSVATASPAVG
jgi:phosphatidylglycerol:prolipoprotein diacylglycerol transferase